MKKILTSFLLFFLFLNLYAAKKISPPRQKFISSALALKGTPYKWGGETPKEGLDCSGLINYVNKQALNSKVPFPRKAQDIYDSLFHIEKKQREPGDLVFFSDTKGGHIFHVGIYCGLYPKNGIEEKFRGKRVFVSSLSKGESGVKISLIDEGYWTNYHPIYARFLLSTDDYNKKNSTQKEIPNTKKQTNEAVIKESEIMKKSKENNSSEKKQTIKNNPIPRKKREPKIRTKTF